HNPLHHNHLLAVDIPASHNLNLPPNLRHASKRMTAIGRERPRWRSASLKADSALTANLRPPVSPANPAHLTSLEPDQRVSLRKSDTDDTRRRTGIRRDSLSTGIGITAGTTSGKLIGGGRCVARSRHLCSLRSAG